MRTITKECEPINKEKFLQSITATMAADEDFFKKVYGYSYCDSGFLSKAAGKLLAVGRKDIIEKYNQWFARYQEQRGKELKEVAHWYARQIDDWYEREVKKCNKEQQVTENRWLNMQMKHLTNIKNMET